MTRGFRSFTFFPLYRRIFSSHLHESIRFRQRISYSSSIFFLLDSPFYSNMFRQTNGDHQQSKFRWYQEFERWYMQFLLITTLYVMEPWERYLILTIFILICSLITYSAWVYIPYHFHHFLRSTLGEISI